MNFSEIENIERRAYENAVFATGYNRKEADEYIDKIYAVYFSQNSAGYSMVV